METCFDPERQSRPRLSQPGSLVPFSRARLARRSRDRIVLLRGGRRPHRMSRIVADEKPNQPRALTVALAVIGISAPLTAAVHSHVEKERELANGEVEQEYKALDRASCESCLKANAVLRRDSPRTARRIGSYRPAKRASPLLRRVARTALGRVGGDCHDGAVRGARRSKATCTPASTTRVSAAACTRSATACRSRGSSPKRSRGSSGRSRLAMLRCPII